MEKPHYNIMGKKIKTQQKQLKSDNSRYTNKLEHTGHTFKCNRMNVYRNNRFLVQEFKEKDGIRITVNRTMIDNKGRWLDNISWTALQNIKNELGYADKIAVEIFPKEKDIVNVANMRHLWILDDVQNIGWVKK